MIEVIANTPTTPIRSPIRSPIRTPTGINMNMNDYEDELVKTFSLLHLTIKK